jgi:hypothetical protein
MCEGVRDMEEGGRIKFDGWGGLNEYEQMAAKAFEEGIENTLEHQPPFLSLGGNKDDVSLHVQLSEGLGSPAWKFSLKEAMTDLQWGDKCKSDLVEGLLMLVELVSSQLTTKR